VGGRVGRGPKILKMELGGFLLICCLGEKKTNNYLLTLGGKDQVKLGVVGIGKKLVLGKRRTTHPNSARLCPNRWRRNQEWVFGTGGGEGEGMDGATTSTKALVGSCSYVLKKQK